MSDDGQLERELHATEQLRQQMKAEQRGFQMEREEFLRERKSHQEGLLMVQGDLVNAKKETAKWKAKYEGLISQTGDIAELKAKYECLQNQLATVGSIAVASTEDEKNRAEVRLFFVCLFVCSFVRLFVLLFVRSFGWLAGWLVRLILRTEVVTSLTGQGELQHLPLFTGVSSQLHK